MFGYIIKFHSKCIHRSTKTFGNHWSEYSWEEELESFLNTNVKKIVHYTEVDAEYWDSSKKISYREDGEFPDIVSELDISGKAYVVWVEWSSGDSFGWGKRNNREALGLFEDFECAKELQHYIEEFTDSEEQDLKFEFMTSDCQLFQMNYVPWIGYFDQLDHVYIDEVLVK